MVLLVFFRDLAPARVEIHIQLRDQRRKVGVGHIDKFQFRLQCSVQLLFKAQAVVCARRAAVIRHHTVAQLEVQRRRIRSRTRGLEDRVRIAMLRGVALDRADHRAGDALPTVLRQDVNALDLHAALVDPFPAAAARRLAIYIDNRTAAEQMRIVVFRVPLMYLTHDLEIILVQLRREHQQICVFRVDKFDLHPASLLQIICHQHCVLRRCGVEIPAHPHLPETCALIQCDRGRVGGARLKGNKRQPALRRALFELFNQRTADALPTTVGRHRDIGDVPLIQHGLAAHITDRRTVLLCDEEQPFAQLLVQHVRAPRRVEACFFDLRQRSKVPLLH